MRIAHIAFALSLLLTKTGLAQQGEAVDSVVLMRKQDLCVPPRGCAAIPMVVLRRRELQAWILDSVDVRARSIGFYQLPPDVLGKVPWCEVVMSDNTMATLSIYRGTKAATVRGYHHCLGEKNAGPRYNVTPIEKQRLLDLEALIDSAASRAGRFHAPAYDRLQQPERVLLTVARFAHHYMVCACC
jgi:hypothetical protein